jgi:hypothetical protein
MPDTTDDLVQPWAELHQTPRASVLLGNGFSLAYDAKRFAVAKLADIATFGEDAAAAGRLFEALDSHSFEYAALRTKQAGVVVEALEPDEARRCPSTEHLGVMAQKLSDALTEALIHLHPETATEVAEHDTKYCQAFLSSFRRIFTTNFDLLLYWAMNRNGFLANSQFADGFGKEANTLVWPSRHTGLQNIHYLHGALHLYSVGRQVVKLSLGGGHQPSLVDQIKERLSRGDTPLVVVSGTSDDKVGQIYSHPYLLHSLIHLATAQGAMSTYGFNFSENDDHVIRAIVESRVQDLVIGVHEPNGPPPERRWADVKIRLLKWRETLNRARATRHLQEVPLRVRFASTVAVSPWAPR